MDDSKREADDGPILAAADAGDVDAIKLMLDAAFSKYIERLGKLPAAMTADYDELVRTGDVHVLRIGGRVLGSIMLLQAHDSIEVHNLVVHPSAQGRGYGRILMGLAESEARGQGLSAITLYTNVMMHENIALYLKAGFIETGRRAQDGFDRVFFRKELP